MRRAVSLSGLVVLLSLPAAAQDTPSAEVFGGYSYSSLETGSGLDRLSLNGWNASVSGNVSRWLGVVGDVSGHYGSQASVNRNIHSFLFGPRFSYREKGRITPFVHALFGTARAHRESSGTGPAQTETKFSMALGGGLDVHATDSLALRIVQADYLLTRFDEASGIVCIQSITTPCPTTRTGTQHNFRFSAGVVFRFGKR